MVKGYSGADRALGYLFDHATEVSFTQILSSGTPIGTITIDGVSATIYQQASVGNVKDVLVDGVSVVDANGDAQLNSADFGTPVEANPVEPATDDLTTIKIGTTVYDLPSGGGSSYLASDFYSTDEEVVGSWTDDKPVYQKTVALSSLSAGANNVTITNLEHLVSSKSFIIHNDTDYLEVPYFGENYSSGVISEQACYVYSQAGKVVLFINTELLTDYTKAVLTVQYTKSTDAAGTAPTRNNLIYIPTLYSERERQVGVWTDGKPLYQKTWVKQLPASHDLDGLAFVIDNDVSYISEMVCGTGYMTDANNNASALNGGIPNLNGWGYGIHITQAKKLALYSGYSNTYIGNGKAVVTLQYTKTTDTPGSGRWTPTGQFAHHYSTDEQIIGTWIDGSTLYERTWDFGSDLLVSNSSWTDSNIDGSSFSKIINVQASDDYTCRSIEANIDTSNHHIRLTSTRNNTSIDVKYLTIQYTKTSS